jgi:hypothetical protein
MLKEAYLYSLYLYSKKIGIRKTVSQSVDDSFKPHFRVDVVSINILRLSILSPCSKRPGFFRFYEGIDGSGTDGELPTSRRDRAIVPGTPGNGPLCIELLTIVLPVIVMYGTFCMPTLFEHLVFLRTVACVEYAFIRE